MKQLLLLSSFTLSVFCGAQNLVPNWSFEDTIQCPDNFGQLNRTTFWFNPNTGTPDYFNSCNSSWWSVPFNAFGNQNAHSGNGYTGCYYGGPGLVPANNREYIETQLTDSMQSGHKYCVSFYVSLGNNCRMGISNVGCYISNNLITASNIFNLPVVPQIENPVGNYLLDTLNWMRISDTYIANGGEQYITIGNFHDDSTTDSTTYSQQGAFVYYYYIDDVSVIEIVAAIAGSDTSVCRGDSVQLGESSTQEVSYSWQPSNGLSNSSVSNPNVSPSLTTTYTLTQTQCDVVSSSSVTVTINNDCSVGVYVFIPSVLFGDELLYIQGLESNSAFEVFDSRGRSVFSTSDYQNNFGSYNFAAGIYLIRLTRPNGEMVKQKLCIIR